MGNMQATNYNPLLIVKSGPEAFRVVNDLLARPKIMSRNPMKIG